MKCLNCKKNCEINFEKDKKFCKICNCSYIYHVNYDLFNEDYLGTVNKICTNTKSTERNIEESIKLAKTFGTVWLPLGIQPSEVDRFLKYFPSNTDIRRSMFMKSDQRCLEVQLQLPMQDRSLDDMVFLSDSETSKKRATVFFDKRMKDNSCVARIDHLDRSEGNTCSDCLDSMGFGEVCVMLPKGRQMSSEVWHPHCFKCIKCNHLLIDYLFCWDTKTDTGPYCLRHFDDKYNARCVNCDEMIFDETYPMVQDQAYHQEHFRCSGCDLAISDTQFVLESNPANDNKVWKCIDCLKITNNTYCVICSDIIEVDELSVTMDGLMTHDNCIKCRICHEKISLSCPFTYVREKNFLFCLRCNSLRNSDTCVHCKNPINQNLDDTVSWDLSSWHSSCLNCVKCHKQVSNNEQFIFVSDEKNLSRATKLPGEPLLPVCKDCFMAQHIDICEMCKEKIDDSGVKYNSQLFHRSCFLCYQCKCELNPSRFTTKDDRTFCVPCHSQLFCKTCSCCSKAILGYESSETMISFENRNWHEACFLCTNCQRSLMESGFLFDNEKIICIECGVK